MHEKNKQNLMSKEHTDKNREPQRHGDIDDFIFQHQENKLHSER